MPVYLVSNDEGDRVPIDKAVVFIGRHPECDIVLTRSRKVSRKHCCVAQVNNTFFVRDLGSMNGVRLNGQRVQRQAELKIGDELAIGDVHYVLTVEAGQTRRPTSPKVTQVSPDSTVAPATSRQEPLVKGPPLDLSQEFPVPIDDDVDVVPPKRSQEPDSAQLPQPASPRQGDQDGAAGDDEDIRLLENELAELQRSSAEQRRRAELDDLDDDILLLDSHDEI